MDMEQNCRKGERGITLLLVVVLLSAILAISLGIFNVIFGQLQISGEVGDSFQALNAAERGIERTLYRDRAGSGLTDGDTEDNTSSPNPLDPQLGCFRVVVHKAPNCGSSDINTCITAMGQYQCGTNASRSVRRGFRIVY